MAKKSKEQNGAPTPEPQDENNGLLDEKWNESAQAQDSEVFEELGDTTPDEQEDETKTGSVEIEKTENEAEKKALPAVVRGLIVVGRFLLNFLLVVCRFIGRILGACWGWLKRRYFFAANAVYDYCYLVGVQFQRDLRRRRKHFARRYHHVGVALRERHHNRKHLMQRKRHNSWRKFTAPVRSVRTRWEEFRKELKRAHNLESDASVARAVGRLILSILGGLWSALKWILNYAAPVAGITLFVFTVGYFSELTLALRVEYNGEEIGYISEEAVFNQAETDMKARIINESYIKPDDIIPKFELSVIEPDQLIKVDDLTNKLIQASGNDLTEADGLYIQNRFISAVADGGDLLEYLNGMLEKYDTNSYDVTARPQFVKKVQVKHGLYPVSSVKPLEEITEKIGGLEKGEKRYTVVSGDDGLTIAAKNGITFTELKAMNPEVDVRLMPGDELLISNSVPYMSVKVTKTEKYEEELEYKIEQETDSSQTVGYTKVKQEGETGIQEVTAEVVIVDGVETSREVVNRETVKQPVNQILVVGGYRPLKVIPSTSGGTVSSGAFGWPAAAGGSITTAFLGYYGHTGSDITYSGCYGGPIVASADGVVVVSGWRGSYGNCIIIDHGGGYQTLYAHCSQLLVGVGTPVSQGDLIAYIGRTGNVTGPHLHFEVRVNGTPVNAAPYLYG